MAKGMPSMMALLGLLAVAGYQNRDKLSDMLSKAGRSLPQDRPGSPDRRDHATGDRGADGGILSELGGLFGGGAAAGTLSRGLGELIDRFQQSGHREEAESWVATGPNRGVPEASLEQALGADTISDLAEKTGLSKQEILARLSQSLPQAVDQFTPNGRIPTEQEAISFR